MSGIMSVWEKVLLAVMIVSLIVILIFSFTPVGEKYFTLGFLAEHLAVFVVPAVISVFSALAGGWRLSVLSFLGIVLGLFFGEWFGLQWEEMGIHEGYAVYLETVLFSVLIGIVTEILWNKLFKKK